jgi:DNA mismatch repair protein MutL
VNVHPRKETILWHQEEVIKNTLTEILSNHLRGTYIPSDVPTKLQVHDSENSLQTLPFLHAQLKEAAPPWYHALAKRERTILQVHNTYLITESADGLLIVDQHAAHERILYQEFLELFERKTAEHEVHELETPVLIRLSPTLSTLLEEQQETLTQIGYQIEPFGEHTYRVCSVPLLLRDHSPQRVIEQMLNDLKDEVPVKGISQFAHRTLAYLACRSAVKAGDPLTQAQAEVLLEKLQETPFAFSCPHGRPTLHQWDWKEIEKLFHRR